MFNYRCPQCGNTVVSDKASGEIKCSYCGCQFNSQFQSMPQNQPQQQRDNIFNAGPSGKSRGVAGIFAILLGALGIHYFYMGKNTAGIICILITILSCGILGSLLQIATIVQGILIMTMTEQEFESRYINSQSTVPF